MAFILTIIGCFLAYAAYQTYQTKKDMEDPLFQMIVDRLVTEYIGKNGGRPPGHVMPEIYRKARKVLRSNSSESTGSDEASSSDDDSPSIGPTIKSAIPVMEFKSDHFHAVLLHQVESLGIIQYQFILCVFKTGTQRPIFFVTSEINRLMSSHQSSALEPYLGIFDENGHHTVGRSRAYASLDGFEVAALKISQEKLGLSEPMRPSQRVPT